MLKKQTLHQLIISLSLLFTLTTWAAEPILKIQHWTTENGARVYFVKAKQLPMVDIQISFDAGSRRDGQQFGIAQFTNTMLNQGTVGMNADQIAEQLDSLGASFGEETSRDYATLSLRTMTDKKLFQPALSLFSQIISEPQFPAKAFHRVKRNILNALKKAAQSPRSLASSALYKTLYGSHPYAHPVNGNAQTIQALNRQDLEKFYQHHYSAQNAVIAIVGDIDRPQAEKIATTLSKPLPTGQKLPELIKQTSTMPAQVKAIPFPSSQTQMLIGQIGISRQDPDYFSLYVGNYILGGSGLVSRLYEQVREQRGLSYSVYSYFLPLSENGPFIMGLGTRHDQQQEALNVVKNTLDDFIQSGPTENELNEAKRNIIGGFPLRIATNHKIVNYLTVIGFYQLPLDYLDTFRSKIRAVSLAKIKAAFIKHVHPDKLITVAVGQQSAFSQQHSAVNE